MFVQLFRSRQSQARFLIWLVRGAAAAAIALIGLFQFVLGSGFSSNGLAPSYLSASLNFGRTEQGKFELSLAMQPHHGSGAGAIAHAASIDGSAAVPAKIAAALPQADATSSLVKANAEREAARPVLGDKPLSCALPAQAK